MEQVLGTESGNPSEPNELGTESGNPGATLPVAEPEPEPAAEEQGTESGNPTRPPPVPVTAPEVPVTAGPVDEPIDAPAPESTDVEPDDSVTVPAIGSDNPSAPPMTTAPGDGMVPGAGTSGAMACAADACQATADAVAASYAAPLAEPAAFEATTCTDAGACECASASGTVTLVAAPSGEDACLVEGRLGCLYSASQFPGCDARMADACAAACGDVHLAMTNDALGLSVDVRASACTSYGCRYVLEVGGHCFLSGDALVPEPVDCATVDASLGSP
jgi:hypothetical protein